MVRRLLPLALAAAVALGAPGATWAAERDNLVPNGEFASCIGEVPASWTAGREWYEPTYAATSIIGCAGAGNGDAGSMRLATGGGERGLHWQIDGARSGCVETPGISADPRPISFAYRPHVHAVQFGLVGPGFVFYALAYDGAGCTGTASARTLYHGGGSADTWYEASGTVQLPARTQSVAFEVATGCAVGVTCLKESGVDQSHYLVDDLFLGGDGLVVDDCADPDLQSVTEVDGDLVIADVSGCGELTLPELVRVGGDLVITETDASAINVGDLTSVGGDLEITGNVATEAINLGSLGSVSQGIDITGNVAAEVINLGSLLSVSQGIDITGNVAAEVINLGSLTNVSEGVTIETGGDLDLTGVSVGGDLDITGLGSDSVSATTADGATAVSVLGGTAAMHVTLPAGAFALPVDFTIERQGDEPASGQIDPIAGYRFTFAVPTLNADARLDFTVDLARLDAATRAALLAGVADGSATLAVRGDSAGAQYDALPRCEGGQTPAGAKCVQVVLLGADGQPAAAGSEPAFAHFEGVVGHFSTYAVALVAPSPPPASDEPGTGVPSGEPTTPPSGSEPVAPPSGETATATPPSGTTNTPLAGGGTALAPSNGFRFGRLRRNARRGTASLQLTLPGPGDVVLRGRGLRTVRRSVAGARATVAVRPSRALMRRLNRRGRATVRVAIVYTPRGGAPRTQTKRVTLVKRRA